MWRSCLVSVCLRFFSSLFRVLKMEDSSMCRTFCREPLNLLLVREAGLDSITAYLTCDFLFHGAECLEQESVALFFKKTIRKQGRLLWNKTFVSAVDKWVKQNKMDFLGIPSCLGFGLHAESYRSENRETWENWIWLFITSSNVFYFPRFLVFADMGQSLQAIMEEEGDRLTEKTVLQLAYRIVRIP